MHISYRITSAVLATLVLTLRPASTLHAQNWTATTAPNANWAAVASSANGNKLVTVINGGPIYLSADGGGTWSQASAPATNWTCVASSADGSKLVAGLNSGMYPTPVYVSTNSGASWQASVTSGFSFVSSLACSSDGYTWFAADRGNVYTSTDAGANWTVIPYMHSSGFEGFSHLACTADGSKFVGSAQSLISIGDQLCFGPALASLGYLHGGSCPALACSADGSAVVALYVSNQVFHSTNTGIVTTTNFGATSINTTSLATNWTSVACSADGTQMVALAQGAAIYRSTDSSATWIADSVPDGLWSSVASSADGGKLVAAVSGGGIYTRQSIVPPVLALTPQSNFSVLSWPITSSRFALQYSPDMSSTNWSSLYGLTAPNYQTLRNEFPIYTRSGGGFPTPDGGYFYRLMSY